MNIPDDALRNLNASVCSISYTVQSAMTRLEREVGETFEKAITAARPADPLLPTAYIAMGKSKDILGTIIGDVEVGRFVRADHLAKLREIRGTLCEALDALRVSFEVAAPEDAEAVKCAQRIRDAFAEVGCRQNLPVSHGGNRLEVVYFDHWPNWAKEDALVSAFGDLSFARVGDVVRLTVGKGLQSTRHEGRDAHDCILSAFGYYVDHCNKMLGKVGA